MPIVLENPEHHFVHRIGWLRAAVLGANDGIVSTASLIVGVAAATPDRNTLLIAGPPDLLDEDAAFENYVDEATQKQIADQDAALKGQRGAMLQTIDAGTGETLAEYTLESLPVFDGLIVAGGRAFIATSDGHVLCLGQE